MEKMDELGGICIAAHATLDSGLLRTLRGGARVQAWRSEHLRGVAIPGAVADAPHDLRQILENLDAPHVRDRPLAALNAADVTTAADAVRPGATVQLRMTEPSWQGLRHALSDPESRILLNTDPPPAPRPVIKAVHWDGGYLDGQTVQLAEQLSVLIGAPGSGKSTVIESIRAAFGLDAHAEEAAASHKQLAKAALHNTTISVVLEYPLPHPSRLVVRRTYPNPPEVLQWETFNLTGRPVSDLKPLPEVYGQHEIAELSEDAAERTQVLRRFVPPNAELDRRIGSLNSEVTNLDGELQEAEEVLEEALATGNLLESLEAEHKKWVDEGIAAKLEQRTVAERESRALKRYEDYVVALQSELDRFNPVRLPPPDVPSDVAGTPFAGKLFESREYAVEARERTVKALKAARAAVTAEVAHLATVRTSYKLRRKEVEDALKPVEATLGPNIKASELSELQAKVDAAREALASVSVARTEVDEIAARRRERLLEREEAGAEAVRQLERAANRVSQAASRVRVTVVSGPDMGAFRRFAQTHLSGFRGQSHERLEQQSDLSFRGLAEACGQGADAVVAQTGVSANDARKLAGLSSSARREMESLGRATRTYIELNVAMQGPAVWRKIEDLSRGQKATAVLLLLLQWSEAPLLVDQPEDDLDNRFIVQDVVPTIRRTKAGRQYIFATHNANVPVLADAELIAGLTAADAAGSAGHAVVLPEHCGAVDRASVRDLVVRQLEGGRDAFDERRRRYGRS